MKKINLFIITALIAIICAAFAVLRASILSLQRTILSSILFSALLIFVIFPPSLSLIIILTLDFPFI